MKTDPELGGVVSRTPKMPIATKLALLVMTAVATAAVAMSGVFLWLELAHYAEAKTRTLLGTAQVFASATAQPTAARNAGAAYQAMKAIAHIPGLSYARIDVAPGQVLAVLGAATQLDADLRIFGDKQESLAPLDLLSTSTIEVNVPIVNAGVKVGRLILVADTRDLADQLLSSLRAIALGASVALAIGLLIAARLQSGLTSPLRELSQTISGIRRGHNYNARVQVASNDEVGLLIDGFNTMIEEIQERDARLESHRRNLEQEVTDRTRDFRMAKDAAEAANAAKSDFLATMSHEIRTPMNGVMVMAELLAAAEIPPRERRYAEVISKSGQSLLAIINDILDFSKIESGKLELEQLAVDPAELAEDVTSLFGERAREKGLDLVAFVAPQTPRLITGDPVRINQVISNLINNALKFTQSGSVELDVGPDPKDASRLRFSVTDTGIGIRSDKLADIFGAFTQADQSTTRRFGGTGLGLAISKRLIEAMGGELTVTSVFGEGSTFAFSIPSGESVQADPWPRACVGAAPTAIVAIGGSATRAALTRYLASAGYQVEVLREDEALRSATVIVADPDRLSTWPRADDAHVLCLATLGDTSAHQLVRRGRADAAIARPLARSEILGLLTTIGAGAPLRAATITAADAPDYLKFPGLRVLVADDAAINREVAIEALRRLDANASTVENGLDAIAAAKDQSFDVVLMDVSMPVVDGFEAARRIRADEQTMMRSRTPIVAVTAHVIGGAADAWRDAGMDAVLYKPLTVRALADCLAKIGRPLGASDPLRSVIDTEVSWTAPQADPTTKHQSSALPILDDDILQQLEAIGEAGQGGFAHRVFGLYLEHAPKSISEMMMALAEHDIAAVGRAAHALKSMSLNLGARRVVAAAADIERRANANPASLAREDIAELSRTLAETCEAVALHVRPTAPGRKQGADQTYGSVEAL
jgi:signal transduction histidine kinase/CheY-like chemotaxis protein